MTVLTWDADDFNDPQSEAGVVHSDVGGSGGDEIRLGFPRYVDQVPTRDYWEKSAWWNAVLNANDSTNAVYDATANKTFIAFQGSLFPDDPGNPVTYGQTRVAAYDHASGVWEPSVFVDNNDDIPNDAHGAPSLCIDGSGYLHVFYGAHNTVIKHAKSTNIRDHTAWTTGETTFTSYGTYPQAVYVNSAIYVFYRRNNDGFESSSPSDLWYAKSTNNGSTFGSEVQVTDWEDTSGSVTRVYPAGIDIDGTDIHLVFQAHDDNASPIKRHSPAHVILDTTDDTFEAMDGTSVTAPFSDTTISNNLLIISSSDHIWTPTLTLFSGIPHVIFNRSPSGGTFEYQYTYWNGSAWTTPTTIGPSRYNLNGGVIAGSSGTDFDVYVPETSIANEDTLRGGDLIKYHYNGAFDSGTTIMTEATAGLPLYFAVHPRGAQSDLWILFWPVDHQNNDPYQYVECYALDDSDNLVKGIELPGFVHVLYPGNESSGNDLKERARNLNDAVSYNDTQTPSGGTLLGENVWSVSTDGWEIGYRVLPPQDDFTVLAIVKIDSLANNNILISGLDASSQNNEWQIRVLSNGSVEFWVRGWNNSVSGYSSGNAVTSSGVISTGTWYVIGISKTGRTESDATYKIYVNATEEYSNTRDMPANTGFWEGTQAVNTNHNNTTTSNALNGNFGPLYVVSGYAMSATEHSDFASCITGGAGYLSSKKAA